MRERKRAKSNYFEKVSNPRTGFLSKEISFRFFKGERVISYFFKVEEERLWTKNGKANSLYVKGWIDKNLVE